MTEATDEDFAALHDSYRVVVAVIPPESSPYSPARQVEMGWCRGKDVAAVLAEVGGMIDAAKADMLAGLEAWREEAADE